MTDGSKCKRNRRIRAELYPEIEAMKPGQKVTASGLARKYSTGSRHISGHVMGNLLREMDTLQRIDTGVWVRVVPA